MTDERPTVAFVAVSLAILSFNTVYLQNVLAEEFRPSETLQVRIMIARETALERQDVRAVRALLRVAAIYREKRGSVSDADLSREIQNVEQHLDITAATPGEHQAAVARVFVPHELHADISYVGDASEKDPRRTLDVYVPINAKKAPALIWIHGGGLTGGDKAHPGLTLIKPDFFLSHGFVFVSVNYRLVPDHMYPAFMNDSARAVAWVHANIAGLGGDPEKINLIGHSAGAHISCLMATNQSFLERQGRRSGIIKSVISLDIASYDFARRVKLMGPERESTLYVKAYGCDERVWIEASPARQIESGENLPPFLLLYAGDHHDAELMRKENKTFLEQLQAHGTTATLYEAAGRTHESLNLTIGFRGDPASREIIDFLRRIGMVDGE